MISVIIPTYRRLHLLKRAVACVYAQSFTDWELILSSDDPDDAETWRYLQGLAAEDARVRIALNAGPHGQAGNVNNCLKRVRGDWVKPLYDDDVMLPDCLAVMEAAVRRFPDIVMAGCLARHFRDGKLVKVDRAAARAPIEIVNQRQAHLAMYLQDLECGGIPTDMLINARAIRAGAIMPDDPRYASAVDQLWFAEILRHGDRLHLPVVLVEEHQGAHESVTRSASREGLDRDNILVREYLYSLIPSDVARPPLPVVRDMVMGIRGLHRLFGRQFAEGFRLLFSIRRVSAVGLAGKWLLRMCFPGYFTATPRLRYKSGVYPAERTT
jgi:glycosyltransferase involved in cell wall biosynthesis